MRKMFVQLSHRLYKTLIKKIIISFLLFFFPWSLQNPNLSETLISLESNQQMIVSNFRGGFPISGSAAKRKWQKSESRRGNWKFNWPRKSLAKAPKDDGGRSEGGGGGGGRKTRRLIIGDKGDGDGRTISNPNEIITNPNLSEFGPKPSDKGKLHVKFNSFVEFGSDQFISNSKPFDPKPSDKGKLPVKFSSFGGGSSDSRVFTFGHQNRGDLDPSTTNYDSGSTYSQPTFPPLPYYPRPHTPPPPSPDGPPPPSNSYGATQPQPQLVGIVSSDGNHQGGSSHGGHAGGMAAVGTGPWLSVLQHIEIPYYGISICCKLTAKVDEVYDPITNWAVPVLEKSSLTALIFERVFSRLCAEQQEGLNDTTLSPRLFFENLKYPKKPVVENGYRYVCKSYLSLLDGDIPPTTPIVPLAANQLENKLTALAAIALGLPVDFDLSPERGR